MAYKPTIEVKDHVLILGRMYAELIKDDDIRGFRKGEVIHTSRVLSISDDGKTIETNNTIYRVVD